MVHKNAQELKKIWNDLMIFWKIRITYAGIPPLSFFLGHLRWEGSRSENGSNEDSLKVIEEERVLKCKEGNLRYNNSRKIFFSK